MADDLIQIQKTDPKDGTKLAGFVRGGQNKPPRECGNCIWMGMESCGHPVVIADPELPKCEDGRVPVDSDDCSDYFQSQGNVLIYAVRHGSTEFNDKNAFRGWINVGLDPEGQKQAKLVRKFMQGKKVKAVYCSDLDRACETAKLAAPAKNATKDKNLRPWDVGIFSGKSKDEYQEKLNAYIDKPDEDIPQGESLQNFATNRMKIAFDKYIKIAREEGPIMVVFHSSNAIQFQKQIDGKNELGRPEDEELVPPGGVMVILDEDGVLKSEVVFGAKEAKAASYGS